MRQQVELMNNLRAGDDVITSAGIYGTITEIEEDTVLLEVSEDVEIRVAKSSISRTFTVREEPEEKPAEEEEGEEPAEEAGEEEKAEAAEEAGEEEESEAVEEPKASGNTSKGKK
jgi:preprotein translocase subunit YajC